MWLLITGRKKTTGVLVGNPQVSSEWFSNDVDLFEFCRVGVSIREDTRCLWAHWWETWHLLTQERDFDFEGVYLSGWLKKRKFDQIFLTFVGHLWSLLIEKNLSFHMVVLNVMQKTAAEIMYCQICLFICPRPSFNNFLRLSVIHRVHLFCDESLLFFLNIITFHICFQGLDIHQMNRYVNCTQWYLTRCCSVLQKPSGGEGMLVKRLQSSAKCRIYIK